MDAAASDKATPTSLFLNRDFKDLLFSLIGYLVEQGILWKSSTIIIVSHLFSSLTIN